MRVLVVQESDWIERGPHQSHHLMERLSKRGHEIRVIDFEIAWKENRQKSVVSKRQVFNDVHRAIKDGEVTIIRPSIIRIPILDYFSLIFTHYNEIQKQIIEFKPNVIIGFGIINAYIAILLAKRESIPFVYYIIDELHQLVPEKTFRNVARYIESQNMKNADKVLSINEGLREYTINMGATKEKTEVISAGVDIESFSSEDGKSIRLKYGIKNDDIVLFFMGWLYDFSGLKEVALELAKVKNDNIKLLIVGKGDLWDTLHDIRKKYGLEKEIIVIDWVRYEDVPKYLSASDICLLPSYKNDIMRNIVPIKMYEYMAAGKPIISTDTYGIVKEFGNNSGIIYLDKPENAIRKAIDLVKNGKYVEFGGKSKMYVEGNSWKVITDKFERSLKEVL